MRDSRPRRRFYSSVPAQTLMALSFNIISLFAGGLISVFTPRFSAAPWILALFPPILTIRGDISGIFSGNLTTMLHLGLVRPQIRGNTEVYRMLIATVFVITFIDALAMGAISFTLNLLLGRAALDHLYIFASVPTVSCVMAVAVTVPLTSLIAIATFRRGLDPDILVYPILSSINDIVVAASFVATASLVLAVGAAPFLLSGVFAAVALLALSLAWRSRRSEFFSKAVREGTSVVILSSLFGSVNGILLTGLRRSLTRHPGLVILYPSLMSGLGNVGSIVGSITTTSLALGYVRSFREEVVAGLRRIFQVESVAAVMHVVFGISAYLLARTASPQASLPFLVGVALLSNLSSFIVISFLALGVSFLAFRRGLNPDNVVIPAITSTSDMVATLSMLPAMAILRSFLV
ncbi:MAG: magnesium transporter [Candidatus Bathyarchaeota archaeon]|nr:magnesium transporter [Candidatus Bathyarchaeota archaeon]